MYAVWGNLQDDETPMAIFEQEEWATEFFTNCSSEEMLCHGGIVPLETTQGEWSRFYSRGRLRYRKTRSQKPLTSKARL